MVPQTRLGGSASSPREPYHPALLELVNKYPAAQLRAYVNCQWAEAGRTRKGNIISHVPHTSVGQGALRGTPPAMCLGLYSASHGDLRFESSGLSENTHGGLVQGEGEDSLYCIFASRNLQIHLPRAMYDTLLFSGEHGSKQLVLTYDEMTGRLSTRPIREAEEGYEHGVTTVGKLREGVVPVFERDVPIGTSTSAIYEAPKRCYEVLISNFMATDLADAYTQQLDLIENMVFPKHVLKPEVVYDTSIWHNNELFMRRVVDGIERKVMLPKYDGRNVSHEAQLARARQQHGTKLEDLYLEECPMCGMQVPLNKNMVYKSGKNLGKWRKDNIGNHGHGGITKRGHKSCDQYKKDKKAGHR